MCDYLLMGMPKRLARKAEELVTLDSGRFSGTNCRFRVECEQKPTLIRSPSL